MSEANTKPKPVYIAPELHRRLKSEAAKSGKTLADHIAAILAKRRAAN
jgi:predicted HicB family RNase H-like nuclease